jgi:hypothetical protein
MSTAAHTAAFRARNAEQDAVCMADSCVLCVCGKPIMRGTMGGLRHNAMRYFCSDECRRYTEWRVVAMLREAGVTL